jgi:hypothetical protein
VVETGPAGLCWVVAGAMGVVMIGVDCGATIAVGAGVVGAVGTRG